MGNFKLCMLLKDFLMLLQVDTGNCLCLLLLEDVFGLRLQKTSSRRLDQDEYIRLTHTSSEDVFKTSSSRPTYSSWSYVFKTSSRRFQDVLKTSSRHLQDVFKTYYQVKVFLVTQFQDIFETYSKRF